MEPNAVPQNPEDELGDDMLEGARAITKFLYKKVTQRRLRKVYYLAQKSNLPIFRLGSVLHARRSELLKFITSQEERAVPRKPNP
ncbi:DNA-binding protein [Bradyrhizobium sp. CCGUVB1N3]|uniref:DNA-binding protein n=1 Tax=Bradyrhizobium sp. CCGUVB1N3 TaxID=2949629 RepID=UPI0020B289D6|nr:DNA-binding protein [Bradyrhizobium sp. CCGUVB1N3]MCP3476697.1 DNA-binding protein [Bradyrhizobium sp. CCGUVB1N3]